MFSLRPATAADRRAIHQLIWTVRINPMSLNWRRFLVAVDDQGRLLGCGQVKPHHDGSRELASIAVQPEAQGQGIGSAIILRLLAEQTPPLYLTCQAKMEPYYRRFGFTLVSLADMPPYFQRLARLAAVFQRLLGLKENLRVMVKRT